jgi:hypothetical protein
VFSLLSVYSTKNHIYFDKYIPNCSTAFSIYVICMGTLKKNDTKMETRYPDGLNDLCHPRNFAPCIYS